MVRIVNYGCILILAAAVTVAAQPPKPAKPARADFRITGTLVDAKTGQPIARGRVAAAPVAERSDLTTFTTGEDGRFVFANLAPGKYALTAQARGYLLRSFDQHDQYSSSIAVGPDINSEDLVFRLPPEGAISGVVIDEAGEPVREAQVMLYFTGITAGATSTRVQGRTMTDDEGGYHFRHLAPGRYLVAVSARPWYAQYPVRRAANETAAQDTSNSLRESDDQQNGPELDVAYPVTFFPGVSEAGAATPIVLGTGEKFAADFTLQPAPALHIRLSGDPTDPTRQTYISLEKHVFDGPAIPVMAQTLRLRQGEEEILGLAPGHYTMRTHAVGPGAASEAAPSQEIDVTANGNVEASQTNAYVPVMAKLQLDPGTPSGQASIQVVNKKSREARSERFTGEGEAVFKEGLLPGSYEVSVFSGSGIYAKSLSATGATVIGRTIEIQPGAGVKLTIIAASGQGAIKGTALREGKPRAGVMIVLAPADPAHNQVLFRRDQSDSDGTFNLPNVVPGAYTLLAIENGWELEWMNPEVLKNYLGKGIAVQVQPNGKYDLKVSVQ